MSRWPDWRHRVPRILGVTLFLLGVVCVIEAFSAAFRHTVDPARGIIDSILLPTNGNLAYAAFVFLLAAAIARRKRIAWRILLFLMWLQVIGGLVIVVFVAFAPGELKDANGHTVDRVPYGIVNGIGLLISVAVLVLLYASRREFYAPVRHASFRRALGVTVALLVAGTLVGWAIVAIFPGHLHGGTLTYLGYAASKVLGGSGRFTPRSAGDTSGAVQLILGLFGAIAVIAGFATLLASQRAGAALPPEDERRIRKLLDTDGERDSLGYFATRRDKSAVFSPSGKAAVTYRVVNDVSLASGDPIGDPEAWGPAVDVWLAQARRYAWVPAVMGASEEGAVAYQRAGLKVLELGDEAVLDVPSFTLDGREMRPVRQAVNRLERAGYTVKVARHDTLSEPEMADVVRAANAWRDTDTERGFSMALGRLGDPTDGRCVLVEAFDGHGDRVAMLSLSPWGRTGLSLDLMRRDRHADNGVMELMVTELIRAAPRLGVNRISLNFAVFRSVFEEGARIGAGPILRAWRRVLLFFSRWWQLESLYRSNVKYQPEWVPRFLCLGERRELVKVGIASAIAEGFFAWPPWRKAAPLPAPAPAGAEALGLLPEAGFPTDEGAGHDEVELPEQDRVRREKLEAIREAGIDPYPVGFARTHSLGEVAAAHPGLPPDSRTGDRVGVAGRVLLVRDHGTRIFATLRDWSGDLQVMLESESDGSAGADLDSWRRTVDLGDHVGVAGEVITTRRGELSVLADRWTLTAKCLHPLPDKYRGVADPEAKVRRRYLDLITSPAARDVLRARSNAIASLRDTLRSHGFMELETPILQRIHGGANARPFTTHINVYNLRLYLRIAPELFLKRLAVGGLERVFEIGRTFRNEGVSFKHNPEFTMLEAYQAYADYRSMLELTRELITSAAIAATGEPRVRWPQEDGSMAECDIGGQWPVRTVNEAISTAVGEEVTADTDLDALHTLCDRTGVPYDPKWGRGAVVLEMYERLVEHHTREPTFYLDFPTDVSPLTRQHRVDPRLAERWDLVAFGTELGTAYSELIDPVEQRRRLTEQSLLAAGGDPEAMELDEDFLTAIEYAMPPTGGLGVGVDRLVMLLTGHTIRETLPFPMVRPA